MLEITVWNVNHGSATYIKTPNGRHIVVDLGAAELFSPLLALAGKGVTMLDVVVLTHPHRDHLDDIFRLALMGPKVLHAPWQLSEDAIRRGNRLQDMPVIDRYLDLVRGVTFPAPIPDTLTTTSNFGGVKFQVFAPRFCDDGNINNHSLVLVASYAGLKVVIPGDNEAPSWKELLRDLGFVTAISGADVLVASHHGRDAGYCPELFEAMGKPRLVVVSDGRFGDTSATDRYSKQATGWTVYDSLGQADTRNCVTTRCDGHISIKLGWTVNDPKYASFLTVTTSNVNVGALTRAALGWGSR